MKLMPRATIATIANVSVWEVLRRSIVTSFITLLPIIALFVFGGATLQDFAFAIMVGIIIGAVSTIFIATPLLTVLMERSPEYARRAAAEAAASGITARPERSAKAWLTGAVGRGNGEPDGEDVGEEPAVQVAPVTDGGDAASSPPPVTGSSADARREARRQRRRSRPHGRAR
jgi:MFS superfamily sulfate permease-like transporter